MTVCKHYRRHVGAALIRYLKGFGTLTPGQAALLGALVHHMVRRAHAQVVAKVVRLRALNFVDAGAYGSAAFRRFARALFGRLVAVEADPALEEFLIGELLSIAPEVGRAHPQAYFAGLRSAWAGYLEAHCERAVAERGAAPVLLRSFQRVFSGRNL